MKKNLSDSFSFNGRIIKWDNLRGREIDVSGICADWYKGPSKFNTFYVDFNGMFVDLIENIVDVKSRIRENRDDLESISLLSDETSKLLDSLIDVVNYSSRPVISEDRKRKYSDIMASLADNITKVRKAKKYPKPDLTIVPMKGGSYFLNYLERKKVHSNTLAIECKRIPIIKDNSFCFGMNLDASDSFPSNNNFKVALEGAKNIRIVELCIVSGMTTIGFLLYLHANKLLPEIVEVNTIAMSQQGYEVISDFAKKLGIKIKFVTGGMFYRLGNYYVSRRDELLTLDGKLVIGDVRSFLD